MPKIGYARVSTGDQTPALQIDALKDAGCDPIFTDHGVSGVATKRPQLDKCLNALKAGDTLVVWRLDRLGRSLRHLLELTEELRKRDVGFTSLSESLDTTSPQGMLILSVMGALAQFERSLIAERTAAGRASARKRGVTFGRPRKLNEQQVGHAHKLAEEGKLPTDIGRLLGVSRATAYRVLARS